MQAGDGCPVRWLRRVKRGASPAAAETSLCFIKTVYRAFLTSPFCSITAFSSRTASHSFQLDFIWTKREGHTVTCLASWKHSHSKPQRGVGTRVCPQSCSSFKVPPNPILPQLPKPQQDQVTGCPLLMIPLPKILLRPASDSAKELGSPWWPSN